MPNASRNVAALAKSDILHVGPGLQRQVLQEPAPTCLVPGPGGIRAGGGSKGSGEEGARSETGPTKRSLDFILGVNGSCQKRSKQENGLT